MSSVCRLDKDIKGKKVDQKLYRGMIGSLLYLTASGLDIMYKTCMCTRFQSDPRESHLITIKRIMRYLEGTRNIGLWYDKNLTLILNAYTNSDFVGYKLDRKSTSGCQFLENNLISWFRKKQNSIALSIAKVEYVAVESCYAQILWIKM